MRVHTLFIWDLGSWSLYRGGLYSGVAVRGVPLFIQRWPLFRGGRKRGSTVHAPIIYCLRVNRYIHAVEDVYFAQCPKVKLYNAPHCRECG